MEIMACDEFKATNGDDAQNFSAFLDYLERPPPLPPNEPNPSKDTADNVKISQQKNREEIIEENPSHGNG